MFARERGAESKRWRERGVRQTSVPAVTQPVVRDFLGIFRIIEVDKWVLEQHVLTIQSVQYNAAMK